MSKSLPASEKLARIKAGFGWSAGTGPAAAAREVMKEPLESLEALDPVQSSLPSPSEPPKPVKRSNVTRNMVFLPDDQDHVSRIEETLRSAGVQQMSVADIVRVALRAAWLTPEEALAIHRETKSLDARRQKRR